MVLSACTSATMPDEPEPTASVVATQSPGARLRDLTIDSPAVGRSVQVRLQLPVAFDAEPDRQWPVLWLLHGCCDTYDSWTRSTGIEDMPELADVLVVMPEAGPVGFYSDWFSGGADWEAFHTAELPVLLRSQWRAADDQAIAGLSMGGLGAMSYAARHPGMFQAAASYSGDLHTGYPGRAQDIQDLLAAFGEDPKALWGDPQRQADVWAAHNPYDLAPKLEGIALFVSTGNGELGPFDGPATAALAQSIERDLALESEEFVNRLEELDIPVVYDAYGPGTHSWPYWERAFKASLPTLLASFGAR
jgi:S-formylglutathione hydrolase FrmB